MKKLLCRCVMFFLTKTIMDKLCELLKIALQNPEGSPEREQTIENLSLAIETLPEIQFSEIDRYIGRHFLEYYDRAIKKVPQNVIRNIHNFPQIYKLNIEAINCQQSHDSQLVRKKFLNYVILIIKRRCIDFYRKEHPKKDNNSKIVSIHQPIGNNPQGIALGDTITDRSNSREGYIEKLSGIEKELQEELQYFAKKLKKYIEEDEGNKLKNCHPRNNKQCNCQILAIKLYGLQEPPIKTKEIARMLNVPQPTVFDRWREYCIPLLKQIVKELGYE